MSNAGEEQRAAEQIVGEPPAMDRPASTTYGPFAYLATPNAALYRRVMKVLLVEKERFTVHVRPEQVQALLAADGGGPVAEATVATPLVWEGVVKSVDGSPLPGAKVDVWQDDDQGFYSQFSEGQPEWNLRGVFTVGADGRFRVHTIKPAPYQIPHDGATGALIEAAGWHAWRPAHLHVKVSAAGHETLTSQLYFPGDEHNDDDIADAVKPELMLDPVEQGDGSLLVRYDLTLDPTA